MDKIIINEVILSEDARLVYREERTRSLGITTSNLDDIKELKKLEDDGNLKEVSVVIEDQDGNKKLEFNSSGEVVFSINTTSQQTVARLNTEASINIL